MIKIEQAALLQLLSKPPSTAPCKVSVESVLGCGESTGDDCCIRNVSGKRASGDDSSVVTASTVCSDDTEDEDDDEEEDLTRRVSFVEPLVTEEWTREYTPQSDISALFYSSEDTTRFRQEYRLEKKVLSDLCIKSEELPDDSDLFSGLIDSKGRHAPGRHHISRVVVLHNDKLQTFFNSDEALSVPSGDLAPSAAPSMEDFPESDNFFDSDSFWSGAVTWY